MDYKEISEELNRVTTLLDRVDNSLLSIDYKRRLWESVLLACDEAYRCGMDEWHSIWRNSQ